MTDDFYDRMDHESRMRTALKIAEMLGGNRDDSDSTLELVRSLLDWKDANKFTSAERRSHAEAA